MKSALVALALLPLPLHAQQICDGPQPFTMPPCLVGAWYGESDAAQKMQAILDSVPEHFRGQIGGDMGRYLFLAIYDDGFFATSPLSGQIDGQFHTEGGVTDVTMDLFATPGTGWMWAGDSGALGICTNPGAGMALLQGTATNFMGTRHGAALSGLAPPVPPMLMDTTCDGDLLLMAIELPEPLGTVTYQLNRMSSRDIPAEMRVLYEDRFGG